MLVLYWLNRRSDTNTFHLESLLTSLMGLEHLSMQSYFFSPFRFILKSRTRPLKVPKLVPCWDHKLEVNNRESQ